MRMEEKQRKRDADGDKMFLSFMKDGFAAMQHTPSPPPAPSKYPPPASGTYPPSASGIHPPPASGTYPPPALVTYPPESDDYSTPFLSDEPGDEN